MGLKARDSEAEQRLYRSSLLSSFPFTLGSITRQHADNAARSSPPSIRFHIALRASQQVKEERSLWLFTASFLGECPRYARKTGAPRMTCTCAKHNKQMGHEFAPRNSAQKQRHGSAFTAALLRSQTSYTPALHHIAGTTTVPTAWSKWRFTRTESPPPCE